MVNYSVDENLLEWRKRSTTSQNINISFSELWFLQTCKSKHYQIKAAKPESSCNKETAQESSITQSNCHINTQNIKQVSYKAHFNNIRYALQKMETCKRIARIPHPSD